MSNRASKIFVGLIGVGVIVATGVFVYELHMNTHYCAEKRIDRVTTYPNIGFIAHFPFFSLALQPEYIEQEVCVRWDRHAQMKKDAGE